MKIKVLESSVNTDVTLYGKMEVTSKNFKMELEGSVRVYCDNMGILNIEDSDVSSEQLYFRGDKVNYGPLLERLEREGYKDLVVELKEINNVDFNCITPKDYPRLKLIFEIENIILWDSLSEEEKILIGMSRVLRNFETEAYNRRLDICNRNFGFNFDGTPTELAAGKVTLEEFTERFNFLRKRNKKFSLLLKH